MNELEKKANDIAQKLLPSTVPNIIDPVTLLAIMAFITEGIKLWQTCNTGAPTTSSVGTVGNLMLRYKANRIINRYNITQFHSSDLVKQTLIELSATSPAEMSEIMKLINLK